MRKLLIVLSLFTLPANAQNIARMFSGTNPQTGTSYTLTQGDETKFVTFSNTSPVAVTIPSASTPGFGPGVVITVKNIGTGNVTITPVAGLINGGASLVLTTGQGLDIYSDGVNWTGNGGVGSGGGNVSSVNTIPKGTGPGLPLVDSTCSDDGTNPVQCVHGLNVGVSGLYYQWGNDTSTGTAQFKAAINNGSGQAVTASTATTTGIIGVVEVGAGTSGNSTLCFGGRCPALFDNSAVSGDWAILSTTVAGEFHDTGSTSQTPGPQNVKVSGANAGAGTVGQITMLSPDSTGTPGMLNPMTTACDLIVGTTAGAPAHLACPTGPNGVTQYFTSTPSGGVGQTESWQPSGIVPRYVSGTSDTITAPDRGAFVQYTNSSPIAVAVPQAGTTGFANNFYFCAANRGSGNVVFTPATSTVNGNTTFTLATNASTCFISDNANYITKDSGGGGGAGPINNLQTLGPNPWYDLSRYGLYTGTGAALICSTTATSTSVTCPGGTGDFAVGNGIEIPGAGISPTFTTWGVANITNYARAANIATYTFGAGFTYGGPTFGVGQTVTIAGLPDSTFNGTFTIIKNSGDTGTFTVSNTGSNVSGAGTGTATLTSAQVVVSPQGILNGSTTYAYKIVLRGFSGELSAASSSGTTTVGASTLGVNTVTVSGCTRTSGVSTCTTSSTHNFQPGITTDLEGVSDTSFVGAHMILTTPTSTTFTFAQNGYVNSSGSTGGTTKVVAKNLVQWNMNQYVTMQSIVYRSINGGAYSVVGIVEGMDGAFVDWGLSAPTVPNNVPSTPPGSPTNGILSTTIANISGTTLTVNNAAVATVTNQISNHDNTPIVLAGCTALGASGVGTLYIPSSNPQTLTPFTSPLNLLSNCNVAQMIVAVGGTLSINEPWIMRHGGMTIRGLSPSGLSPTFGTNTVTSIQGGGYPFFLIEPGSFGPLTFENLNMVVNHSYQSAVVEDADAGGGNVVSTQYINDAFVGNNGGEMPYIARGGFNKFFEKDVFNSGGGWGVPEIMEFTIANSLGMNTILTVQPYTIKLDRVTFIGHGIEWSDWGNTLANVGGYMSINDTLIESAKAPLFTINTSASTITGIQLNRSILADSVIGGNTPTILVKTGGVGALQSNFTYCGNGGPLLEGNVYGMDVTQGTTDACSIIGSGSYTLKNLLGGVGGAYEQKYNISTQLAGTGSVYYVMNTPSAAPTLAVSAGGSVPVSATMCFGITAVDNNGGETVLGPTACTVTTAGNQTVTITRPTLPGNATGWYPYWNQGVNGNAFSRVPAFVIGAGTLTYVHSAGFGNGNSVPNFTTAGKSAVGPGGVSAQQGTFNQTDFFAQPAPSNPVAGSCRMYLDSGTNVISTLNSSGSPCFASGAPSGAASGDLGGSYPAPTVTGVNGSSVPASAGYLFTNGSGQILGRSSALSYIDASSFAGTHWTDKVVTAYGSAACSSGCAIIVPDSIADNGSATTMSVPSNVELVFPGVASFTTCTINVGKFTKIYMNGATLVASGSNCQVIAQANQALFQDTDKFILSGVRVNCNSQTNSEGLYIAGGTAQFVSYNVSVSNCITGVEFYGAQFSENYNMNLFQNTTGLMLHGRASDGGTNSNTFYGLKLGSNSVGALIYSDGAWGQSANYFINPTCLTNSVACMAAFGNGSQSMVHWYGGAPEANGGGASSITINSNVVKQSTFYCNLCNLDLSNVDIAEATIVPVIDLENYSNLTIANPRGYGPQFGQYVQADSTSNVAISGVMGSDGTFQNVTTYPAGISSGRGQMYGSPVSRIDSGVPNAYVAANPLTPPFATTTGTSSNATAVDPVYGTVNTVTYAASAGSGSSNLITIANAIPNTTAVTSDYLFSILVKSSVNGTFDFYSSYSGGNSGFVFTQGGVHNGLTLVAGQWTRVLMYSFGIPSGSAASLTMYPNDSAGATVSFTRLETIAQPNGSGAVTSVQDASIRAQILQTGAVNNNGYVNSAGVFSVLPTCAAGYEGRSSAITDSTTATWGATITGGGANHVQAYCDGTNWTVSAK